MEAIILAGGLGTRLGSRLADRPKAMALIAGRPFLEILLERLAQAGCKRLILSVGYLRHVIMEAFPESYAGIPITYVTEESPLGTGGAIKLALKSAMEESVLVLNGDTYLEADLRAMLAVHQKGSRSLTMAIARVEDVNRYGEVIVEQDTVVDFAEKGRSGTGFINGGIYVIERTFSWPAKLRESFSFEMDVLIPSVTSLRPVAFPCPGYFLDIGIPSDLDRAQVELMFPKLAS
jgi:D-glycero-alpha-D-manno-heptose 1-phosphate guanylyltransferase